MVTILSAYLLGLLIGYVFGAFPTGFFVGKMWNIDVRKHGSGRTGGTNVLRSAGWGAFALTVIGDVLKGILPVLLVRWLFPEYHGAHALSVLGVLIGNNWSVWIALLARSDPRSATTYPPTPLGLLQRIADKGRGGAGVSTTAGACLALFPPVPLLIAPVGILVLLIWRYASVASLTAATLFPIVMFYFVLVHDVPWSYFALALVVAVFIYIVHIPNIQRLRAGNERRFGQRLGRERNA